MHILQANIPSIEELWKESYIALNEIEVPAGIAHFDPLRDISNFIIIIALMGYLILAHRRILKGFAIVGGALLSNKKLMNIENQSNLQICRNSLFWFLNISCSFLFANIAYATKIIGSSYSLPIRFAGILGFITLFFALRKLILQFLGWVNISSGFNLIHKISYTYTCVWYLLVFCCFCVIKSIPSAPMGSMRYCMIFSLLPIMGLYFFSIYRIFISKGFSHVFYILYLCTLEILPIVMLLYLNFN